MSISKKVEQYNRVSYGIIIGLVLPVLGFVISYFIKTRGLDISFGTYFRTLLRNSPDRMDIIIFSMIPNLFLFYWVNFKWGIYEFTKGFVAVTLVYAIVAVLTGL
jgi:hypothetical protein